MTKTYEAILRGDHIEWVDGRPPEAELNVRFKVSVTVIEPVHSGEAMAAILQRMSETIDVQAIFGDAAEWQREQRKDRPLPGRD